MRIFGHRFPPIGARLGLALAVLTVCIACGKKGPPLAPRDLSPAAPTAVRARRLGDRVYLTFTIPSASARGAGPYSIDHLDIFAVTIGPGMVVPPNRDLLLKPQVIGTIPVRQIEDDEQAEAEASAAPTPASDVPKPGDETTFIETLSAAALEPRVITKPEKTVTPAAPPERSRGRSGRGGAAAPGTGGRATPAVAPGPAVLSRFYVIRGVTKQGKPGGPSQRLVVPLLAAPEPPRVGPSASWDATSVTIAWDAPPSRTDEVSGLTYNVYPANANANAGPAATVAGAGNATPAPAAKGTPPPPRPLNPIPIDATSFSRTGAEADKEQCFVVRSVAAVGVPPALPSLIESEPSAPLCVTPKDTFPPDAPKSLAAVASAGAINLIWDANVEADLAGYLVLRAEAPGATLQPLMREPIKETRYGDRTAKPGVRYVYAIIAVDKAGNRSGPSNRVEDAAR